MKRSLIALALFIFVAMFLLTVRVPQPVLGKAHVPTNQFQFCHKGRTAINVDKPARGGHLRHGDFQLPVCDFANVFGVGADCSFVSDTDGDGFADAGLNERDEASGTPGCPAGGGVF